MHAQAGRHRRAARRGPGRHRGDRSRQLTPLRRHRHRGRQEPRLPPGQAALPDTTAAWAGKLPKRTRHRLYGTAANRGCLDRATLTLDKGARKADWPWLALQDSLTLEQAAKHPSVTAAVRRWQSCMSQAGHTYPAPEAAIADGRWDLDKPAVTEDEKLVATADTTCKWSAGLVAAWYAADAELQRAVIRDNADRFAALRANLKQRLGRASRLLAEHEGRQVR